MLITCYSNDSLGIIIDFDLNIYCFNLAPSPTPKVPGAITTEKNDIGYVSGNNQNARPLKVKATIANIPVATESFPTSSTSQGELQIVC